jgi:IclR family KDG regulon transcriptional repressor
MAKETTRSKPVAGTVITAAQILEYIAEKGTAYPRDLSKDLDLNRSTVHRMLYTLEALKYIGKRSDGAYHLTFHLFEIGNSVPQSHNLIDPARRELIQLSHDTGLTVNHGVLYDDQVLYVDKAAPATYLQLDVSQGESEPLHCTSVGKVLLAFRDPSEREAIIRRIPYPRYTENTITDPDSLLREVETVAATGYAIDRQELAMEIRCVAVPIRGADGFARSGVSISGPADRLTLDTIDTYLPRLHEAVRRIESNMA